MRIGGLQHALLVGPPPVKEIESWASDCGFAFKVLVEALVALSRPFDMFTVAERVETRDEAQWLARAGVDCLQGFYFGAPATRPDWAAPGAQTGHKVA